MRRIGILCLVLMVVGAFGAFANGQQEVEGLVEFDLWTQADEATNELPYLESLVEEYMEENDLVSIDVADMGTEDLREDFQTASIAGEAPELLWTVNDHAGPFTLARIIQPIDDIWEPIGDNLVEPEVLDDQVYGIPITSGNHLMLMYNKQYMDEPPQDTDEFKQMAQDIADEHGVHGFSYNATEPFWLVPWLGGFGGEVFAADGVTPTLDTPEMVQTLEFLYEIQHEWDFMPAEPDADTTDSLFQEGEVAMIISGDWAIGSYEDELGDDFGVARIPRVSETGEWPQPYTSGKYWMVANHVEGETREIIEDFIHWSLTEERQLELTQTVGALPAHVDVLDHPEITEDPILAGSASQLEVGTPMPSVPQMRANWDAMRVEMNLVLADDKDPAQAAADMQQGAEAAIEDMDIDDQL